MEQYMCLLTVILNILPFVYGNQSNLECRFV